MSVTTRLAALASRFFNLPTDDGKVYGIKNGEFFEVGAGTLSGGYKSDELTTTAGEEIILTHGLGARPALHQLEVVTTVAVTNVPLGTRFEPVPLVFSSAYYGVHVVGLTDTTITVRCTTGAMRLRGAAAADVLLPDQFKLIVRAWA